MTRILKFSDLQTADWYLNCSGLFIIRDHPNGPRLMVQFPSMPALTQDQLEQMGETTAYFPGQIVRQHIERAMAA